MPVIRCFVELAYKLREADDHGLLGWCFSGLGMSSLNLVRLRDEQAEVWAACTSTLGLELE